MLIRFLVLLCSCASSMYTDCAHSYSLPIIMHDLEASQIADELDPRQLLIPDSQQINTKKKTKMYLKCLMRSSANLTCSMQICAHNLGMNMQNLIQYLESCSFEALEAIRIIVSNGAIRAARDDGPTKAFLNQFDIRYDGLIKQLMNTCHAVCAYITNAYYRDYDMLWYLPVNSELRTRTYVYGFIINLIYVFALDKYDEKITYNDLDVMNNDSIYRKAKNIMSILSSLDKSLEEQSLAFRYAQEAKIHEMYHNQDYLRS